MPLDPLVLDQISTQPKAKLSKSGGGAFVIGIPKEVDSQENRVALVPDAVSLLVLNGLEVWVEKNAGEKANFSDSDYVLAGAFIKESHDEIFKANVIVKINTLTPHELEILKPNTILFSAIESNQDQEAYLRVLMQKKVSLIAFEYLEDQVGNLSIVRAMSEIAGSAVLLIATEYLSSVHAGKGIVLGGITGLPPTQVLILGAGTVAEYAARSAMGLGASVKIFDSQHYRLRRIQYILGHNTYTGLIDQINLKAAISEADVVIGALRGTDSEGPFKVPEEWVAKMKKNSVIIDVGIDHGGCFETSKPTSHYAPMYKQLGVLHYCVPNIASRFAHTASLALSNILNPLLVKVFTNGGLEDHIFSIKGLKNGLILLNGHVTNAHLAARHNLKFKDLSLFMAGKN
jgi:alanine dehydrogenase